MRLIGKSKHNTDFLDYPFYSEKCQRAHEELHTVSASEFKSESGESTQNYSSFLRECQLTYFSN